MPHISGTRKRYSNLRLREDEQGALFPPLDLRDDGLQVGEPNLFQLFHEGLEAWIVAQRVEFAIVLDPLPVAISGIDTLL